jgi:two-component system cell cycle sensor histidine kinase/response regulator CckA
MKKKILVVDDDRVILKFVSDLLLRDGHEVAVAGDGFAALGLLADYTPDIMFFDLIMPKIDGRKLIKIVRGMPRLKDSYLVIISAAMAEIDFSLDESGADAFIAKGPFSSMARHFRAAIEASESPQQKGGPIAIHGLDNVYARQLTKELLSINRHLETVLESTAEGILEIYSGKVIYANSIAVSLFGLPMEKILVAHPLELFDEKTGARLDGILKSNTEKPVEIGQKTPIELNGRQITIKVLPVKGEESTHIIMITDVTERRRLELQLQHKQKMEAIGTIAAGVAHNFRNTLTEIMVNSQLIQMNFKDVDGLHAVAGRINTSVKRGADLVSGLLQFSRKQLKEKFFLINLSDIINEIIQIIEKTYDPSIKIEAHVTAELPIIGDPTSLGQAIMNLFNNARDAMPDGGRLTITARRHGEKALVKISDEGAGMDRETAAKCFDPFYTTKPTGKGTGLGLSTTYGIIKSHEGTISVDSQPGRGTTFKVHLPLASEGEPSKLERELGIIYGNGELILVVDDEPEILGAMKEMLKHLGYRTEVAANGAEALDKYRHETPHAVLMDINMPEMDGVACIAEILNLDTDANIAVFSGYDQDVVENLSPRARQAIKDFVPKPVGLEDLSVLLAKMLKKQK